MDIALILFVGGIVIVAWIFAWTYLNRGPAPVTATANETVPDEIPTAVGDAVLISRGHGQLVYANPPARKLLGMNGGTPELEQIARMAQPSDSFLSLFAGERQSAFQLGSRWIEASSHRVPTGNELRTFVVMRELTVSGNGSSGGRTDALDLSRAMRLINQIGETVNAAMGVEQTLQTLLTLIKQEIPFDAGEINLKDPQTGIFEPRGWAGDSSYLLMLAEAGGGYRRDEGITGWIARHQQPILLDSRERVALAPKVPTNPYQSLMGVPLAMGDRLIGTLELAALPVGQFTAGDFALLQAVSKPVTIAIYNATLYAEQVRRIDDISTLQQAVEQRLRSTPARTSTAPTGSQVTGTASSAIFALLTQRIAELAAVNICGILTYDEARQGLAAALPFYGVPDPVVSGVLIPLAGESPQREMWEHQSHWISNDMADEPMVEQAGLQGLVALGNIQNTVWMPLQVGERRVGLLLVANHRDGSFTTRDLAGLRALAAQAAIVVENIQLARREQTLDAQLSGLQELTNAISALTGEQEFYTELSARIARLMDIEMCGILTYDEAGQRLVRQLPFYGVADEVIADYTISLAPGTVFEELWSDNNFFYINRVMTAPLTFAAGLDQLAEKLGVEKTLFAVLASGSRRLGVVQVSNKRSGQDFNDTDARLLLIFATQAAAIIENARLFREVRHRSETAQQLRNLAEVAGTVGTSEEGFSDLLAEVARVTESQIVFVNVLQPDGNLVTYPSRVFGYTLNEILMNDTNNPGFENSVVRSWQPFLSNDVPNDQRVLPSYRVVAERFGLKNAILVPLVLGERTLGELGVANRPADMPPYNHEDIDELDAISAQVSAALDRLLQYQARGASLNRRVKELNAIASISNELTLTLDFDQILNTIRKEALIASDASGASVALLHPADRWFAPDEPLMDRRLGNASVMQSLAGIELEAISRGADSVVIPDYAYSDMFASPPEARSAVAAAILYYDQVVGVLHIYHTSPNHFDEQSAAFIQTMAAKATLGYGNATRFREQMDRSERLRRRVEQLNRIFELGHMLPGSTEPVMLMEAVAYSIQQAVGYDQVLMLLYDEEIDALRRVAHAGLPLDYFEQTRSNTIPLEELESLLARTEFLIADSYETYLFPVERVTEWYTKAIGGLVTSFDSRRTIEFAGQFGWRDGDLLLVQIRGTSGNLLGAISLDRPQDNLRPDRTTVEVLEIFAHQASSSLENTRLYQASVRSAEQETRLNTLMETVSSSLDAGEIVESVATGISKLLPFNRLTIALLDSENRGFEVVRGVAATPGAPLELSRDRHLDLTRTAMGRTYIERTEYVYRASDDDAPDYDDLKQWHEQGERVSVVLPLLTGGEVLGTMHIGSNRADTGTIIEAVGLLKRLAQLISAAIQNARLYNRAVGLQVLNESVIESIQQGIVVLTPTGRIISINPYMRTHYGWGDDALGRDLFKFQSDMAALIGLEMSLALDQGIPQEALNQQTTGSELVRNFYLYPMRRDNTVTGIVLLIEDISERARLEETMEERANQLAALTEVANRISQSLEREEVVTLALEEMKVLMDYDAMTYWRRNGSYMVLEGYTAIADLSTGEDEATRVRLSDFEHLRQMVDTQRVLVLNADEPMTALLPGEGMVRSWMGVPLVNQGHVVGMFVLTQPVPYAYDSKSDQNIAFAFASHVAIALANADLFEQTFDRTNELGTLLEAAQATSATQDLNQIFQTVTELMLNALEMDQCTITIWDEVENSLTVESDVSREVDSQRVRAKGTRLPLEKLAAKLHALRERDVVVITRDDTRNPYQDEIHDLEKRDAYARMLVPLVAQETSIGLIQLEQYTGEVRQVTQQKVRLARALGTQVAGAIQNARLSAEMASMFNEALIINDLSRAISSKLKVDDMLGIVRDQVPAVTGSDELYLALYDEAAKQITFPVAVKGGMEYSIPPRLLGNDEVSFIIRNKRNLSLGADYFSPDDLRHSLGITDSSEGDAKSYLGIPLKAGDKVIGVLALRDTVRTRAFTINDQRILETVASQLGTAIQNAQLYGQVQNFASELNAQVLTRTQELEAERDRLDTLYQITSELSRTLDMERLQQQAIGMVAKAVNAEDGAIFGLDPMSDSLYTQAFLNPYTVYDRDDGNGKTHPAESLAQWLAQESGEISLVINDLHLFEHWDMTAPGAIRWRSALAVVLESSQNDPQGVMVLLSTRVAAFGEPELRLLVAAANQVASSINNADLYHLIRDQAERLGTLLRAEQEEAEKNSAILESIADGVILSDADGKVILFNTAAERILQVPREQVLGQPLSKFAGIYGTEVSAWAELIQEHAARADYEQLDEFVHERLTLGERTVSVHLSPVYTSDRLLGIVSVFRDITQDVEIDRMKSEFISSVSHELRTPLTPIKGYTDLLLMGAMGSLNDMQNSMVLRIKENVDRLTILVEDVLDISKIDSGRERLKIEAVQLDQVIDAILDSLRERPSHQRKDLSLVVDIAPEARVIRADRSKLSRILSNIIDNAFNYTMPGGSIDIRAAQQPDGKHTVISVRDTGVGIPEDFRDQVWKRFQRYEEHALSMEVSGTGLGLSIVREMVDMHGGDVWFESEVGKGTTFYIALPVDPPDTLLNRTSTGTFRQVRED